jgi:hypothetical protein
MKKTNKLPKQQTRSAYGFTVKQVMGFSGTLTSSDTDPTSPATLTSTHLK